MNNKFASAIEQAAEQEDFNEAQAGGDFTPLPEGPVRLRFVGYIELGEHSWEYNKKPKKGDKVRFIFEVTGPKIEPREDGQPHLLRFDLTKSQSEKAHFYKLFRSMNYDGSKKVFAQMLGDAFRGSIRHNVVGEGDKKRTYVELTNVDGGFTITAPYFDDPETGERKMIAVPEPVTELMCFLWANPDKEQWDSLFIDGEWEARDGKEAQSKNIHQEKIKTANNWVGSTMQELLFGDLDVGDVQKPERDPEAIEASKDQKAGASADPLANGEI